MNQDDISGQVSANTLFHFTDKRENLVSILTHEFRPHYCLEDLRVMANSRDDNLELAMPMVCFCDLPLMQIKRHLTFYGNYGIGLIKKWGMNNRICPVLYTYPKSPVGEAITALIDSLDTMSSDPNVRTTASDRLSRVSCYIKPYQGNLWKNGQYIPDVKFYNEREWRFIPESSTETMWPILEKQEFLDEVKRATYNATVFQQFRLSFDPRDIRYIVVKTDNEILSMVRSIRDIKGRFDADTVDLLITRIISAEQIRDDF
ncbi:hypothetical protein D4R75_06055 [bacterium]|nr:MAG: hypothetical protein D4R75_06055 [bacterium]